MNYKKPPITECVVEFRFDDTLAFDVIQKKFDKFKRLYPNETQNVEFTGEFSEKGFVGKQESVGVRLASADELQIVVINKSNFLVAQLAPYPGWASFGERVMRDFEMFNDLFGRRSANRLGMRYINRIDIPLETVQVAAYLNVYPGIPSFRPMTGNSFALQSNQTFEDLGLGINFQSGTAEPLVPGSISFSLDLDVFTINEVPKRSEAIRSLLDTMRSLKNDAFEASITQNTRDLLQ